MHDHIEHIHPEDRLHIYAHEHDEAHHHGAHSHTHDPAEIKKIINRLAKSIGHLESVKRMVDIELITVMTIAFLLFLAVAAAATFGYIHVEYIRQLIRFMTPAGYGVLYVIMLIMSILLSGKFTAGIFKDSVMDTYREEV